MNLRRSILTPKIAGITLHSCYRLWRPWWSITTWSNSTLPWWGFVISVLLAIISTVFFRALFAITGFYLPIRELPIPINLRAILILTLNINTRDFCANDSRVLASWQTDGQHVLCSLWLQSVQFICLWDLG